MCSLFVLIQNIKKKMYGSTEAFLADVKWILHNCIIYNGGRLLKVQQYCQICFCWMFVLLKLFASVFLLGNHKLTATAKVIVKICEHEVCTINYKPKYANALFSASFFKKNNYFSDEWDRGLSRVLSLCMPEKGQLVLWTMCECIRLNKMKFLLHIVSSAS